jgi:hypothetical protein
MVGVAIMALVDTTSQTDIELLAGWAKRSVPIERSLLGTLRFFVLDPCQCDTAQK